ncbi:GNAT family N-acetyltransferase [Clavibacter sp. Sh2126]|uniref:GNAT family N-acetyltransferase n=1 Tax=Clavibacter sp. Sh2126 TaxID=3397678 RepID=UPI0039DFC566
MPDLATDRLLLRRFTEADAPFLLDLHARPEVMRWIGTGAVQADPAQAVARAARYAALDHPVRGIWAIEDRDGGTLLGTLLLKDLPASAAPLAADDPAPRDAPEDGETEIGWHLHPDAWGRGVATEAARRVLAHAAEGGLTRVLAVTNPANAPSQAVCRRIGMRLLGRTHGYYDKECALFRIDLADRADAPGGRIRRTA